MVWSVLADMPLSSIIKVPEAPAEMRLTGSISERMFLEHNTRRQGIQAVDLEIAFLCTIDHPEDDSAESMPSTQQSFGVGIPSSIAFAPSQTFYTDSSAVFTIKSFCWVTKSTNC